MLPNMHARREEDKQGKSDAAPSAVRRVVLVGSTGAGKSSMANLLAGETYWEEGPFEVSNQALSCTFKIETRTHETERGILEIVDTPGLGDLPLRKEGESDEEYKARADERSTEYFKEISRELHDGGGLVLYVHMVLRGANYHHVKALNRVLHNAFVSCAGLIITGGFNRRTIDKYNNIHERSVQADTRRVEAVNEYEAELQMRRQEVEEKAGVKFAFVHGVDSRAAAGHPAHTASLLRRIQDQQHAGLDRGIAITWESLLVEGITQIEDARAREANVNAAVAAITAKRSENEWRNAEIKKCDVTLAAAPLGAACCEILLSAFGLFGVGAMASASVSISMEVAKMTHKAKKEQNEAEIERLEESKTAWQTGRSVEELRDEAESLRGLVYHR